ncbi:hypothetical protein B0T25DRAFT_483268 [Lasiosphaeria hispida]|uniref:Uncharacterized protein n=1 Tax=Lasiosphaeria hispida TaxID=260671 RepID=A0AAJ0HGD0_9PEZI|nr:hypothetical protein B0T25DRAFT_483268 [Lasiosphaeria hispida]
MGHSSKFTFPLPGRRSKPAPPPIITAAPLTKAQKILGTGGINTDSPTLSPDGKWWDARSNSGISVAVSETTASHAEGRPGLGSAHDNRSAGSPRRQWDESEIIPRETNLLPPTGLGHDGVTDASSLRRRQSSSTITSYYDKSKLPLSISQQTSNSAMAKGLPTKAQALLDMDGHSESKPKKKKPARLDLSALLPRSRASKAKHLKPDSHKHVLGPDLMTKSPSVMSVSPADSTPPPIQQRTDRSLGKKLTRESLVERPPLPEAPQHLRQPPAGTRREVVGRSEGGRPGHRPTKSTVNLMNLYDHYEQRSFADAIEHDRHGELESELALSPGHQMPPYPSPTVSTASGHAHMSPLGSNPVRPPHPSKPPPLPTMGSVHDLSLAIGAGPLSLISPPADNASISSRHTRTSKASRRTDLSLTDLDLQQNSMLSLSSDSEDDGYEPSSKSSLAIPPALSDGQASPTSPRSAISQRSTATVPQDISRSKQSKRTSFATSPQFLPIPEGAATAGGSPPKINARSSSLFLGSTAKKHAQVLPHQTSRLSIATTSTGRTASYSLMPHTPVEGPKCPGTRNTPPYKAPVDPRCGSFPSPPTRRAARPSRASITSEQPTPPFSPTSVEFYLQSQQSSRITFDEQSIRSSKSVSSMAKSGSVSGASLPRRGSATSSVQEITTGSGRFMAVTRQEEMLLAALRLKRARMREDIIAEFEDELDREEANTLSRQVTGDSSVSMSGVSRQSSMSTMRNSVNSMGTLSARPLQQQKPPRPQIRISTGSNEKIRERSSVSTGEKGGRGQILLMMDRPTEHSGLDTAEPSPDLDDFLGFDDDSLDSKASIGSISGASSISQRPSLSATTSGTGSGTGSRSNQLSRENLHPRRGSGQSSRRGSSDLPVRILEDPREEEGVPRPDSPISPCDFPTPTSMTRKKQVRLSAVGNYKPNIEAGWWDDSG